MVSNSRVRSLADARERREPCRVLMTLAGEGRAGRRPAGVTHVPMASLLAAFVCSLPDFQKEARMTVADEDCPNWTT
jgi:hypothetical protein